MCGNKEMTKKNKKNKKITFIMMGAGCKLAGLNMLPQMTPLKASTLQTIGTLHRFVFTVLLVFPAVSQRDLLRTTAVVLDDIVSGVQTLNAVPTVDEKVIDLRRYGSEKNCQENRMLFEDSNKNYQNVI